MNKVSSSRRELAIYDGRERIGNVVQTTRGCRAFGPTGKKIGDFKTLKVALAAIDELRAASILTSRSRSRSRKPRRQRSRRADLVGGVGSTLHNGEQT